MNTDPKKNKSEEENVANSLDETQQRTDPNITELKGFIDPNLPLEPTEPDPDEVPDDASSSKP